MFPADSITEFEEQVQWFAETVLPARSRVPQP